MVEVLLVCSLGLRCLPRKPSSPKAWATIGPNVAQSSLKVADDNYRPLAFHLSKTSIRLVDLASSRNTDAQPTSSWKNYRGRWGSLQRGWACGPSCIPRDSA